MLSTASTISYAFLFLSKYYIIRVCAWRAQQRLPHWVTVAQAKHDSYLLTIRKSTPIILIWIFRSQCVREQQDNYIDCLVFTSSDLLFLPLFAWMLNNFMLHQRKSIWMNEKLTDLFLISWLKSRDVDFFLLVLFLFWRFSCFSRFVCGLWLTVFASSQSTHTYICLENYAAAWRNYYFGGFLSAIGTFNQCINSICHEY